MSLQLCLCHYIDPETWHVAEAYNDRQPHSYRGSLESLHLTKHICYINAHIGILLIHLFNSVNPPGPQLMSPLTPPPLFFTPPISSFSPVSPKGKDACPRKTESRRVGLRTAPAVCSVGPPHHMLTDWPLLSEHCTHTDFSILSPYVLSPHVATISRGH